MSLWSPLGAAFAGRMGGVPGLAACGAAAGSGVARAITTATGGRIQVQQRRVWGNAGEPFSGDLGDLQIAWLGQDLFAAAPDYAAGTVRLSRRTGTRWTTLKSVPATVNQPPLLQAVDGAVHLVVHGPSGEDAVRVLSSTGGDFTQVGGEVTGSYLTAPAITRVGGTTLLQVTSFFGGTRTTHALRSGRWVQVGSQASARKTVGLVTAGTTALDLSTGPSGGPLQLRTLSADGGVLAVPALNGLPQAPATAALAVGGDRAVIAVQSGTAVEVFTVALTELSNWTRLGEAVARDGADPRVVVDGRAIVAVRDGDVLVRTFDHALLPGPTTTGPGAWCR